MNSLQTKFHRLLIGFYVSVLAAIFSMSPCIAQDEVAFSNLNAIPIFGDKITFEAEIQTDQEIAIVEVVFKPHSVDNSTIVTAVLDEQKKAVAIFDLHNHANIPPFVPVSYWFVVTLTDGHQIQSQTETFTYVDTRYQWQSLTFDDQYFISWVEGNVAFGQTISDVMFQTFDDFNQYLDLPVPSNLKIYVYPTSSSFQTALDISGYSWVGGHANPEYDTIIVAIPTGFDEKLEIQRKIPHEITHIRLYLYLNQNYDNLPVWYSEGIASLAEQYPSTEYWQILQAASTNDELFSFSDLCQSMPQNASRASLAYAQSDSLIRFIFNTYGKIGLQRLLDAYALGHSCEQGVTNALDIDLQTLENQWYQATFESPPLSDPMITALAWIFLLILLLISPIWLAINRLSNNKHRND